MRVFTSLLISLMLLSCTSKKKAINSFNGIEAYTGFINDCASIELSKAVIEKCGFEVDSTKTMYDSIVDADTTYSYFIGNSCLNVQNDSLVSFEINSDKISIGGISVGDSISKLKSKFPDSFSSIIQNNDFKLMPVNLLFNNIIFNDLIFFQIERETVIKIYYSPDI